MQVVLDVINYLLSLFIVGSFIYYTRKYYALNPCRVVGHKWTRINGVTKCARCGKAMRQGLF